MDCERRKMIEEAKRKLFKYLFGIWPEEAEAESSHQSNQQSDVASDKGNEEPSVEVEDEPSVEVEDECAGLSPHAKAKRLELEIPFQRPPAHPDEMYMLKASKFLSIDPKPFAPDAYVEEENFSKPTIHWRKVQKADGTSSVESNARFVEWSDGSMQLLIGDQALDISKLDMKHSEAQLFLRHSEEILQAQGRVSNQLMVIPSSLDLQRMLAAKGHALRHQLSKVKSWTPDVDPKQEENRPEVENDNVGASRPCGQKRVKANHRN